MSQSDWWVCGRPGASVTTNDRGFAYGDGLFETIAVRAGQPRLLKYHLERLCLGAMRLGMPVPKTIEANLNTMLEAEMPGGHGVAKIILSRGAGPRGYAPPPAPDITMAMCCWATEPAGHIPPATAGWSGMRLARQTRLAGMKHLNRLEQVLARVGGPARDWDELLCCDTNSNVICGTMSNVFLFSNRVLKTPALTHAGVAGVMRRFALEAAASMDIQMQVCDLSPDDFGAADEIFLTNSQFGIRPVNRLCARELGIGADTARLTQVLAATGITECEG